MNQTESLEQALSLLSAFIEFQKSVSMLRVTVNTPRRSDIRAEHNMLGTLRRSSTKADGCRMTSRCVAQAEVAILQQLAHDNILLFYGCKAALAHQSHTAAAEEGLLCVHSAPCRGK